MRVCRNSTNMYNKKRHVQNVYRVLMQCIGNGGITFHCLVVILADFFVLLPQLGQLLLEALLCALQALCLLLRLFQLLLRIFQLLLQRLTSAVRVVELVLTALPCPGVSKESTPLQDFVSKYSDLLCTKHST